MFSRTSFYFRTIKSAVQNCNFESTSRPIAKSCRKILIFKYFQANQARFFDVLVTMIIINTNVDFQFCTFLMFRDLGKN